MNVRYCSKRFPWRTVLVNSVALALMLLMVGVQTASAQAHTVKGTVLSATDNTPMPGVNVVETGTLNGTATAVDGTFTLTVSSPNASLSASFVGFVTKTVEINGQSDVSITLDEDTALLEEVVVTAGGEGVVNETTEPNDVPCAFCAMAQ